MAEYIKRSYIRKMAMLEMAYTMETETDTAVVLRMIDDAPAADVAPVVHGRLISFLDGDHIMPERYYRCSRCGRVESRRQPYCHCGAKMGDE